MMNLIKLTREIILNFQNEFIKSRDEKLSKIKNVEFIEMNSINLINEKNLLI